MERLENRHLLAADTLLIDFDGPVDDRGLIDEPATADNFAAIELAVPVSSPQIVSQVPNGFTNADITRITLGLSEPLSVAGANDADSYVLTDLGPDRQPGGGDDFVIPVAPTYLSGTDQIDLLPLQGETINLDNWNERDYAGNGSAGDWRVEDGGSSVKQYRNGDPTFFVSDFDFIDREFVGRIKVETTSDDDYIGIVFGLTTDGSSRPDDYYLLNWKQRDQSNGEAGFKLLKVTGSVGAPGISSFGGLLWDGENATFASGAMEVLAENTVGNPGWADNTEYEFAVRYESNGNIQVSIRRSSDGAEFFSAAVNDPEPLGVGKIGFYNFSQSAVRYSGLQQSDFLPDGSYQLTVRSGDGGLATDSGVPLNGDPPTPGFEDYVGTFTIDQTPPTVESVAASASGVEVEFFDAGGVDPATVETVGNYSLVSSGGDGVIGDGNDLIVLIESVSFDEASGVATIFVSGALPDERYQLTLDGIVDRAGNALAGPVVETFDLSTVPASVSLDLRAASDSGVSQTDGLTNVTTPVFDVTINQAGVLTIDFDGDGTPDFQSTLAVPGTIAVTSPSLADGSYQVTATLTPVIGAAADADAAIEIDTFGPSVLPGAATEQAPLTSRTIQFNEAVEIDSINPLLVSFTGPGGNVPLTGASGSGSTFTVQFDPIIDAGAYQLSAPPAVRDLAGNLANQDGDGINGEPSDDVLVDAFELLPDIVPPEVVFFAPAGLTGDDVAELEVGFSEPLDAATLTVDDVQITTPSGPLDASQLQLQPHPSIPNRFLISIPPQSDDGVYQVTIGPDIRDVAQNPLADPDGYQASFEIDQTGPTVLAVTTNTSQDASNFSVDVAFSESIDPGTLSAADVTITGPSGGIRVAAPIDLGDNTFRFTFPAQSEIGVYSVSVGPDVLDRAGNAMDQNGNGNGGEAGDVFESSFSIDSADLVIEGLAIDPPSGILSGQRVTVSFSTVNRGGDPVDASFYDRVSLVDAATSEVIDTATTFYNSVSAGAVPAGGSVSRSVSLRLPDGDSGVGNFDIVVTADAFGEVAEANGTGDAESNNQASLSFTSVLGSYPDLTVQAIESPARVFAGGIATVRWQTANPSSLDVDGRWTERLLLIQGGSELLLESIDFTDQSIVGGSFVQRERTVTLPNGLDAGDWFVRIDVDTADEVVESDEANNSVLADAATVVPVTLSLASSVTSVREDGTPVSVRINRSGDAAEPLTVNLTSNDESELTVPETVVIPANQLWIEFLASPVQDSTADGNRVAGITANVLNPDGSESSRYSPDTLGISVLDSAAPELTLTLAAAEVDEGGSVTATVSRDVSVNADPMLVTLSVSDSNQISVPISVSLDMNQESTTFQIQALSDELVEIDRAYSVTAKGFGQDTEPLLVRDVNRKDLTVIVDPAVAENSLRPSVGRVERPVATDVSQIVQLRSGDPGRLTVPDRVTIPAGRRFVDFPIYPVDNLVQGDSVDVAIEAKSIDAVDRITPVPPGGSAAIRVQDNDSPTLTVTLNRGLVNEDAVNPAALGTVERNTLDLSQPLTVTLSSDDETEATVPPSVTIPAGSTEVDFDINAVDDFTPDGLQFVTLSAAAAGFNSGSARLIVSDVDKPDLRVREVSVPASALTGREIDVVYRLRNEGRQPVASAWTDRIYLSDDPILGADDALVFEHQIDQLLGVDSELTVTAPIELPADVGQYFVIVQSDVFFSIDESLEDNNRGFSDSVDVAAEYLVTAETSVEQAVMGTPIPIQGTATIADSGLPAVGEEVIVYVTQEDGFVRRISAVTDANGDYSATFTPLPGEAGDYVIAGAHPGQATPAAEDAFTLIGMRVVPRSTSHEIKDGGSLTQQMELRNLSDVGLTSLVLELVDVPSNLSVDVSPPSFSQLAGRATEGFSYTIDVLNDSITIADFTIRVTAAEGATLDVPVSVTVIPRMGRLTVPSRIDEGMLRGRLTPIDVEITNDGGAETGPIDVLLPAASWLSGPQQIESIAPGQTTKLQLVLNPETGLPLGPYSGSLVLNPENASAVSIPFTFTATSDATGELKITVVNELTYYGEGSPNVAGATVSLTNPFTNEVVASGVTDANGLLSLDAIPEGNYELSVAAEGHHTTRSSLVIEPGAIAERTAFIKTRLVTYDWNVEPVEFEDRTRVTIESQFVTNVPIPVIVVDPGQIDLAEVENGFQQIEFTIRNEGLIQAEDLRLEFPSHPLWEITPLIDNIDVLPAKSSVNIPVIIRRISFDGSAFPNDLLASDQGPCSLTATIRWILICGPFGIPYSVPIPILNAHGNCANAYSGGGRFIGGGGGGGGGIGPSLSSPVFNYNPPEECDCVKRSLSLSVGVPVPLKDFDLGPVKGEVKVESKLEVKAETCCPEQDGTTGLKFSGAAQISGEVGLTYFLAGGSVSHTEVIGGYEYSFEITAGAPLELKGTLTGSATVSKECDGAFEACGEIRVGLGASVGLKASVSGSRKPVGGFRVERYGGEAQIALQTGVSGSVKKCVGEDATGQICFDGVKFIAEAKLFVGEEVIGVGFEQVIADASCIPESSATSALDALFEDLSDPQTLVNAYDGTEQDFKAALGMHPDSSLGEPIVIDEQGEVHMPPPADQSLFTNVADVCAVVRLRLEQDVVMTRTAFEATLEVNNGAASRLQDLQVFITVVDTSSGEIVDDRFAISEAIAATFVPAADSSDELPMWDLAADSDGVLKWTLLPTDLAAPEGPTEYTVGGLMTYILDGETFNVPLFPAPITVYPDAALELKYFHQRDVYSDDPFTDATEPSIPYDLGVMVSNVGKGAANNLEIVSAQPEIIENEKGLLIDFQIVGADVNNEPQPKSLTITMGNILPDETRVGRWQLTSTLQGHFVDYTASFEHLTGFGDPRTSIIKKVEIFETIRTVRDPRGAADDLYDFLTNEVEDEFDFPDTVHLSDRSVHPVAMGILDAVGKTPVLGDLTAEIDVTMPGGFGYLRIDDPGNGQYLLDRIERGDGSEVPLETNAWLTDRTFKEDGERPIYENKLHLFDHGGTGSYRIHYRLDDQVAPTLTDIIDVTPDPRDAAVEAINVRFSEPIDLSTLTIADVTLTRNGTDVPLDAAVTFTDLGDGQYQINGLAGFTASAGVYRLTLDGTGVTDYADNGGVGVQTETWTNGTAPVYVFGIDAGPQQQSTPLNQIEVEFSGPIDQTTFDLSDVTLARGETPLSLAGVTIQTVNERLFLLSLPGGLVDVEGDYTLTVDATGVADSGGTGGLDSESASWTLDQTAPRVIDLEQPDSPRKIVQFDFEVAFDEPIDVTTFTPDDLTLTRNAGVNLIDDLVSIEAIDDTTFLIRGTNWAQGAEGDYALTVDGSGITDPAGNAGQNALTVTWVMDFSNPLPPSNLAISPDTGISDSDGLTNSREVTLQGTLAEPGLEVRLYDETLQQDLGWATVTGNQFSHAFTLGDGSTHRIRVRAVDGAGNLADAFFDVSLDETSPQVSWSQVQPDPRDTAVASLELISNEPMNWSLLTTAELVLTRDGGDNLIDGSVGIEVVSDSAARVTGLEGLTGAAGEYALQVVGGLQDLAGNPSESPIVATWQNVDDQLPPASAVIDAGQVTEPTFLVQWSGSDEPGGSGLAFFDVFVSVDGGGYSVWQTATTATSANFAGEFGRSYAFYSVATDRAGNVEAPPATADWQVTVPQGEATIGDFVWNDANFNGIQDLGESGVAGVTVELYRSHADGPVLVQTTTTDGTGFYEFAGLELDRLYSLGFVAPDGFGYTHRNIGSDASDSDVDIESGRTDPFAVVNGLNDRWDAGLVELGSISGVLWNDFDGDGQRQSGEPGLVGWTVYLDRNDNGINDVGEPSRLTDAAGRYEFAGLRPGSYIVAEVIEDGFVQTFPGASGASDGEAFSGESLISRSYSANASNGLTFTPGESIYGPVYPESSRLVGLDGLRGDPRFAAVDGSGLSVVVIDTGIDLDHPFFGDDGDGDGVADRIVYQYDFADGDGDATDYSGHGSHVSSVIGSQDSVYAGIAPGVDIIHLKVFGDDGLGYFRYVEEALRWVVDHAASYNVAAVNLSIGDGLNWTQTRGLHGIDDELAALAEQNVITVAAAGNGYGLTGIEGLAYPAADANTVSVGAVWDSDRGGPWSFGENGTDYTSDADRLLSFSQRHSEMLDVVAPGALITAADADGGVRTMRGTSMATPFVTGAAVLAQQIAGGQLGRPLSTAEFRSLLNSTGIFVVDGDDENDSVPNTGAEFARLNLVALAEAVAAYDGSFAVDPGAGTGDGSDGQIGPASDGGFRYTIDLAPGENRDDVDFGNQPTDTTGPSLLDVADVTPDPRQTSVAVVDVEFDEAIDPATFGFEDLTLLRNGVSVPLDGAVTTSLVSGNTYRISGLGAFTSDEGSYTLRVSSLAVKDAAGNDGLNTESDSWLTDASAPTSKVQPLAVSQTSRTFAVRADGSDASAAGFGSGIVQYEIYSLINDTVWELWTTVDASDPVAMFTAESGQTIGFYSIAIDAAGNREAKQPVIEAGTYLPDLDAPVTQVDNVDTSDATFEVSFSGIDVGGSGLGRFEVFVQVDDGVPVRLGQYGAGTPDSGGVYSGSVNYQAIADGTQHSYRFFTVGVDGANNQEAAPAMPADVTVQAAFAADPSLEVVNFDVQKGMVQRSYVRYLDVTFNGSDFGDLIASLDDGDAANDRIRLLRFGTDGSGPGAPVDLTGRVAATDQVMEFDFGGGGIAGNPNSPVGNGYYRLQMDVDGDGAFDGSDDADLAFYRLFADTTGDRVVDPADLQLIFSEFGQTGILEGDINGDQRVDYSDYYFAWLSQRQGIGQDLPLDD